MSGSLQKVAILGCGSYNPITFMHLRMFEIAKEYLNTLGKFEVIHGIISPVNDRYVTKKYLATAFHRINMIKLALKPLNGIENWIELDDWEAKQNHWVKTIDVLKYHQKKLNKENGDIRLMLLCGSDMFESFTVPNLWDDKDIECIVRDFGLIVINRDISNPELTLKKSTKSPILLKYQKNIYIIDSILKNNISSSYIREAIAKNHSIRYLTSDPIVEYIKANKLYEQ